MKRLEDGEEWKTPRLIFGGRQQWRQLGHQPRVRERMRDRGGRRETATLLTASRSHTDRFDMTSHVDCFGMIDD
jgi:hypothetical protein